MNVRYTVDRLFGRRPRHALGFGAVRTVAVIKARLADERAAARKHAAYRDSLARQAELTAAMDAPTLTLPVPMRSPADPIPTMPITRAELFGVPEADDYSVSAAAHAEAAQWALLTGGAR